MLRFQPMTMSFTEPSAMMSAQSCIKLINKQSDLDEHSMITAYK